MNSTDDLLRRLAAVDPAKDLTVSYRQADLERAAATVVNAAPQRRVRRRMWPALGVAAAVVLSGGVAVAAGLVPDGVNRAFRGLGDVGSGVEDARMVAQSVTPDGTHIEKWVGHNKAGGPCDYLRVVSQDGRAEDGAVSCFDGPLPDWYPPQPDLTGGVSPGARVLPRDTFVAVVSTLRTDVVAIDLNIAGGPTIAMSFNGDTGWGVAALPGALTDGRTSEFRAYDSSGRIVARLAVGATCIVSACPD